MEQSVKKFASPIPSLTSSVINFKLLRNDAVSEIKRIILLTGDTSKNKAIIFDPTLTTSINLIIKASELKELGVISFHFLNNESIKTDATHLIYIVRPQISHCTTISSHIANDKTKKYYVIFLPKKSVHCEKVFEMNGVWKYVTISELPINLIPMDYDLLSMEHSDSFRNVCVDRNNIPLFNCTNALIKFQEIFGMIPFIQGIGGQSEIIIREMLNEIHSDDYKNSGKYLNLRNQKLQIGRMIIIDRDCDYVTPLLSQLIYGGLIDETFGNQDGCISIPESILTYSQNDNNEQKIIERAINSDDIIYKLIRDVRIDNVTNILKGKMKLISEASKVKDKNDMIEINASLNKIKELENSFPSKLLTMHFNISHKIINEFNDQNNIQIQDLEQNLLLGVKHDKCAEWILESINGQIIDVVKIIRVICLYSITNGGINNDLCNAIQSSIIRNYGSQYCFVFENLFKAGILYNQVDQYIGEWKKIKKEFVLLFDDNNDDDISKVYNGYTPLSCRIIEYALTVSFRQLLQQKRENEIIFGWLNKSVNHKLKKLGGIPFFHVAHTLPFNNNGIKEELIVDPEIMEQQMTKLSMTLVIFFVGGITHGEISALRTLTKTRNPGKHIIIMTTKIINGNSFITTLL